MTSTEVSWAWLLTQIHVDSPEDQGPGKGAEVQEMTNERREQERLASSCQKYLILNGTEDMGSQIKPTADVGGLYVTSRFQ